MSDIRQIVGEGSRKAVPDVEVATPSLVAEVVVLGAIIDAMRPRVGGQGGQSAIQSASELSLQGTVVRGRPVRGRPVRYREDNRYVRVVGGIYLRFLQ